MRTYSTHLVEEALSRYKDLETIPDVGEWLANPMNIALTNAAGDVTMFERQHALPDTVCGHYFFKSRGKEAYLAAKEMLDEVWQPSYGLARIIGLTPVEHEAAYWLSRKLGFKDHGTMELDGGEYSFLLMLKEDWSSGE